MVQVHIERTGELVVKRIGFICETDSFEVGRDLFTANLRTLRGLYIDCGRRDQYNLIYGARQLHRALDRLAVPHRYDEFDDDHTAIDYRMDESLPFLARALA